MCEVNEKDLETQICTHDNGSTMLLDGLVKQQEPETVNDFRKKLLDQPHRYFQNFVHLIPV